MEDLIGLYPPGIGGFKEGGKYNFAHGGLSLQEIILPYLRIQQDISCVPVSVELLVEDRIYSGVFKVSWLPKKADHVRERERGQSNCGQRIRRRDLSIQSIRR